MAGNDYPTDAYKLGPDPRTDIKEPLERIVSKIINDLGSDNYAWEAALILLFSHIDLLGHLLSGGSSRANQSKWAVTFIRRYLGKVDEKYALVGGFIYHMLRHGLIHKSFAKRYSIGDGKILGFKFTDTLKRQKHLSVTSSGDEFRLLFNVNIFYKDLLDAIDLYCLDMTSDRSLLKKCEQAWSQLQEPEERIQIKNHAYILESDLGYISDQIS